MAVTAGRISGRLAGQRLGELRTVARPGSRVWQTLAWLASLWYRGWTVYVSGVRPPWRGGR